MRVNVYSDLGILEVNKTIKGATVTDFITLISEPTTPPDAATKKYTDYKLSHLNAGAINTGIVNLTTIPATSGDVVSVAGSGLFNLKQVTAEGSLTFPIVNSKGLIASGRPVTSTDIPAVSWSQVSTGHPTTALGYGINDAIGTSGGYVTVNIRLNAAPATASGAASKKYVDDLVVTGGGGGVDIGDIMFKTVQTAPTGFLRCNGAFVSKTTYASLFTVLQAASVARITSGSGKPWIHQNEIVSDLGFGFNSTTASTNLVTSTASGEMVVTKNKAYLLGGDNGANLNFIQVANIDSEGVIGAWADSGLSLPFSMRNFQVLTTRGSLYLIGGSGSGNTTNFIYKSTIDANGSLGQWTTEVAVPAGLSGHQAFATSSRIYLIGGSLDGGVTAHNKVYYYEISDSNSLSTAVEGLVLPINLHHTRLAVIKSRVYTIGGHNGTSTVPNLIYGTISAAGVVTSWTPATVMPASTALGHCLVTDKNVYYLGGTTSNDLTGATSSIYKAPISVDGFIGSWALADGVCPVSRGHIVSVKNNVYVIGGKTASNTFINTGIKYSVGTGNPGSDYSYYYLNILFTNAGNTEFALPDLASLDSVAGQYYIKY